MPLCLLDSPHEGQGTFPPLAESAAASNCGFTSQQGTVPHVGGRYLRARQQHTGAQCFVYENKHELPN